MPRAKKKPAAPKKPTLVGERKLGRVLITGASAGIGAELVREFAKHGHSLVLVARSKDKLTALSAELRAAHDTDSLIIVEDLSKPETPSAIARELDERGVEIDILVNNAGVLDVGPFADTPGETYDNMVALNVASLTAMTSLFLAPMIERKFGRILNVASLAAFQPVPSMAVYAATKAYVLSLTESLSEELRATGVKVTALCPGLTDTNMVQSMKAKSKTAERTPSMLISDPKDVAKQAYKATMSGQTILVPGIPNQMAAAWAQVTPRWLTRTVTGFASRRADWMKSSR
jgi:short-subunit dehydrogenase